MEAEISAPAKSKGTRKTAAAEESKEESKDEDIKDEDYFMDLTVHLPIH